MIFVLEDTRFCVKAFLHPFFRNSVDIHQGYVLFMLAFKLLFFCVYISHDFQLSEWLVLQNVHPLEYILRLTYVDHFVFLCPYDLGHRLGHRY